MILFTKSKQNMIVSDQTYGMYQHHCLVPSGLELKVDVSTLPNVKGWKLYHCIVFPVDLKVNKYLSLPSSAKCELLW